MTGHRGKGRGQGPASRTNSDKPRQPLVITPEKQRERALKRWADHRERMAQGPEAVEAHRRAVALRKMRKQMKVERRAIRARMPPPACSGGHHGS